MEVGTGHQQISLLCAWWSLGSAAPGTLTAGTKNFVTSWRRRRSLEGRAAMGS